MANKRKVTRSPATRNTRTRVEAADQSNVPSSSNVEQGFASEVFGLAPLNANQYLHSVLGLCHYCMHGSRGCIGCFTKPNIVIAVDEPSKGLRIQGRPVRKSSVSEDIWSSSTTDMDNGAVQSQRSISSISTSNQALDPQSTSSTSSLNPPEFVNHGLLLWNQTRQQWLGNKNSQKRTQIREPRICWNATYESLLGTNKPFPQPVPLSEMIDFLVDVWEQEGLYD